MPLDNGPGVRQTVSKRLHEPQTGRIRQDSVTPDEQHPVDEMTLSAGFASNGLAAGPRARRTPMGDPQMYLFILAVLFVVGSLGLYA